jgi:DinB superfamily
MTELETQIAGNRAAIDEFIAAARAIDMAKWMIPRAEGAWTPAQIAEHLAIVYEYNRTIVNGTAPSPIPRLVRPLIQRLARGLVVDSTLKAGRFTRKGRAPGIFQPSAVPPPCEEILVRLDAAVRGFESDLRSCRPEVRHAIAHPIFGALPTANWIRLQAIHARHHRGQLPA